MLSSSEIGSQGTDEHLMILKPLQKTKHFLTVIVIYQTLMTKQMLRPIAVSTSMVGCDAIVYIPLICYTKHIFPCIFPTGVYPKWVDSPDTTGASVDAVSC